MTTLAQADALRDLTVVQIEAVAVALDLDPCDVTLQLTSAVRASDTRSAGVRIGDVLIDWLADARMTVQDVQTRTGLPDESIEAVLHGNPEALLPDLFAVTLSIGVDPSEVFAAAAR